MALPCATEPGNAKPAAARFNRWNLSGDSGSGTYFGVDPELDMVYILMEQTQNRTGTYYTRLQEIGL